LRGSAAHVHLVPRALERLLDLGGEEKVWGERDDACHRRGAQRVTARPSWKPSSERISFRTSSDTAASVVTTITASRPVPPPAGRSGSWWGSRPTAVEAMLMPCLPNTVPIFPIMPGTSE